MSSFNRGFSLIELLVAMAISMFALVAITEMYSGTRQTYRLQAMQSRLSEDGRFAVSMLQRLISQAGYRPSFETMPTRIAANSTTTSVIIEFTGDGVNTMTCNGSVVLANVAKTITIFQPGNPSTSLRCNDNGNDTDWIAAAVGQNVTGNGTEVVDFRIDYGEDVSARHADANTVATAYSCGSTTQDCVADSYTSSPTGNGPVVSVKLCFILRSEAVDSSVTKTALMKNCAGIDIADSQNDHKLYRSFNTTVLLKNR